MIKSFFLTSLLFFSYADTVLAANKPLSEARHLLQSNLPVNCNFSGTFQQSKKMQGIPIPLISSGNFFFACEYGLIWQTKKPFNESRIYTTQDIHFSVKTDEEPTPLNSIANFYLADFLLNIMTGNVDAIYKNYLVSIQQQKPALIILEPQNKYLKKGLKSISLQKNKGTISVSITDANQQLTTINIQENKSYTNNNIINICAQNHTKNNCMLLARPNEYEQD